MEHWPSDGLNLNDVRKIRKYLETRMTRVNLPADVAKKVEWYVLNGQSVRIEKTRDDFWSRSPSIPAYSIQVHAEKEIGEKIAKIIQGLS